MYPGCIVDVLFTSKLSGGDRRGQAVTITILQGIQVLSVWGDVIASIPTPGQSNNARWSSPRARGLTVTLLVDPKQAEVLQLASDNGTLSLTIRNPLDKDLDSMIYAKPGSKTLPYYESLKLRIREIIVIRGRNTPGDSQQAAVGDPNE
jgi:Flp pilus assembly protein CpaB